ncbi:hypothetical protein AAGG74_15875 [Bacillus mexicanus]|uniref:hypothetical protein n=1 Tax=Bacillus mexicanus TaxID=2834415 RepID=UPI003D1D0D19
MTEKFLVTNVLFFGTNLKAGVIVRSENDSSQKALTYEEIEALDKNGCLTNARIDRRFRKDYNKEIVSLQPINIRKRFDHLKTSEPTFPRISAREFYKNPFCPISDQLFKELEQYYTRVQKNMSQYKKGKRCLSYSQAQNIRKKYSTGVSQKDLADEYGVSTYPINQIVNNKIYLSPDE